MMRKVDKKITNMYISDYQWQFSYSPCLRACNLASIRLVTYIQRQRQKSLLHKGFWMLDSSIPAFIPRSQGKAEQTLIQERRSQERGEFTSTHKLSRTQLNQKKKLTRILLPLLRTRRIVSSQAGRGLWLWLVWFFSRGRSSRAHPRRRGRPARRRRRRRGGRSRPRGATPTATRRRGRGCRAASPRRWRGGGSPCTRTAASPP